MANLNYSVMASASTVIIDETDASYLSGNLNVISGSRTQMYYTGESTPHAYSPNWSIDNLVIRPYLTATNIRKVGANGQTYNPDLFNPIEYRTWENNTSNKDIITDIHWFIKDTSGVEKEILDTDTGFKFRWIYNINNQNIECNDARQLVINENILKVNSSAEIICKFSYNDPFAKITIPQQYNLSIINLATGRGVSKAIIEAVNGNSIHNGIPEYIELEAHYFKDGNEIDLQEKIEDASSSTSVQWFIRDISNKNYKGWMFLDAADQIVNNSSTDNNSNNYDVCRKIYNNDTGEYETEITNNSKGGVVLKVYPDLISGSDTIKLVVTDEDSNGATYSDLMIVYDNTDTTKVFIHLSNGNRLRKSIDNIGTTAKAVITYKGVLLDDSSPLYDSEFIYYWYKYNYAEGKYYNLWHGDNPTKLSMIEVDMSPTANQEVQPSGRSIYITPDIIEEQEEIILHIVEKEKEVAISSKNKLLNEILLSEDELNKASKLNKELGLENDFDAILFTANELKSSRK